MLLRCVQTGEEFNFTCILSQILNNHLQRVYEIIRLDGKVCYKRRLLKKPMSRVTTYIEECRLATRECIQILNEKPYLEKDFNKNIYCPFHEQRITSKTPSAKLYVNTNTFKCFSKRCNRYTNSISLLRFLKQVAE